MEEEKIVYKINDNDTVTILIKAVMAAIIAILIYNFKINPLAFAVFITIAIYVLSRNSSIIIYEDRFIIKKSFLFNLFRLKKIFNYSEIDEVRFLSGRLNPLNLIFHLNSVVKADSMTVKMKSSDKINAIFKVGGKENFLTAIKLINDIILTNK